MTRQENEQYVKDLFFEKVKSRFTLLIKQFVNDTQPVLDEAETIFDSMLEDMAYIDKTDHPMAASVFSSCATLSVYLALKEYDVDVHDFGCAMLKLLAQSSMKPENRGGDPERLAEFIASGKTSQQEVVPGEYVFDVLEGDQEKYDWGVNIKSCALCQAFSKYEAMDLVPYFCAMNDVMSDMINQGLRRTGTIALGSKQCLYRYKIGGEPLKLADQYPDRIRYVESS